MAKKDYRTAVLGYLIKNAGKEISRETLMKKAGVSKSRLSEVLRDLRKDGYTIVTPPRSGIVRLESTGNESDLPVLPTIKDRDLRQWTILLLLSRFEKLTFQELLVKSLSLKDFTMDQMKILMDTDHPGKAYDNARLIKNLRKNTSASLSEEPFAVAREVISVTALRNDLKELRDQNLVRMKKTDHTYYELTGSAPYLIPISADSLFEFCQRYEETASASTGLKPFRKAYRKIQKLINLDDSSLQRNWFGRVNELSQKQIDTFYSFIAHPYKTNVLLLESTFRGKTTKDPFAVGLLFFSVETSSFYAFGKNLSLNRLETRRLDWIETITTLPETHQEFHHSKYYRYYSEMFSASYEENAHQVKILFQDFGNVSQRFSDLASIREHATIRPIDNPPEGCFYHYVYEDTVRGLSDFARYLRSFGIAALALEPPELKEKMLFTYNRIIQKYETNARESTDQE